MCGIVAAIASENIVGVLLEGLKRLEYRGYDSAGLATLEDGHLSRLRTVGRVAELKKQAEEEKTIAKIGIAHTRWATHGAPTTQNAHPHISDGLALVHNGIIENHAALRRFLQGKGYVFTSETDTEVIAHLIADELTKNTDLFAATKNAIAQLEGAYALAVLSEKSPNELIVARQGSPLLLGISEEGIYAASDASALLQVTRRIIYLENGDCARLKKDAFYIEDKAGNAVLRAEKISTLSAESVELGNYRHFMQKEIFEQPTALANTLEVLGDASFGQSKITANLFGNDAPVIFAEIREVLILACGTSAYAGLVAHYWIEEMVGIPCRVEVASEYRYRKSVVNSNALIVVLSQSGETADTLAALEHAKNQGMTNTLCICNVPESSLIRQSKLRFITRAGPEIGVASTKAFTTQLAALYMLSLTLGKIKQKINAADEEIHLQNLRHLPVAIHKVLALEPQIKEWAAHFAQRENALFLGRGHHYPIALEGALKLKEITYIHAEAYPAGELKHGPLALVDDKMPVIAVAPNDHLLEKLKSNLQEVRARGGVLYVFADADSHIEESLGIHVLRLPEHYGLLSPLLHVIPLQLLAYHVAIVRGTDVDKPRNLAKSVTVE